MMKPVAHNPRQISAVDDEPTQSLSKNAEKYPISDRNEAQTHLEKDGKLDSIAALSGGIAHDYNNLLTAIIGNITLAQAYLERSDRLYGLLENALAASKIAKKLTQKLITFSKGGTPQKVSVAVERLVKNAVDFTLSGSNLGCTYHFPSDLRKIQVDQSQIGQAIHNAVMNAREAMREGGVVQVTASNITLNGEIPGLKKGDYVKISIADQGCGIAAKELEKIFDPYYSTKKMGDQKGMGLGLSICRSIVRKHGGEIAVKSKTAVGTTLQLYLPAADAKSARLKPTIKARVDNGVRGAGKILVMDDEAMIRTLCADILKHLGYEVELARDGAEALAGYEAALKAQKPFDAVILDLTVKGGMGGKATIQRLKAIDPNVKAIVSSGYSDDPGMMDFGQYGFSGVVAKPYSVKELGLTLNLVINHERHPKSQSSGKPQQLNEKPR
jgi:nitrogen-specific signal transduction histidine kinase/FixJ family two-component response regulator